MLTLNDIETIARRFGFDEGDYGGNFINDDVEHNAITFVNDDVTIAVICDYHVYVETSTGLISQIAITNARDLCDCLMEMQQQK
jgi:hypothetical protein